MKYMKYMKYIKLFEELIQSKTIQELETEYTYFHLSWDNILLNNDGKTFTFIPRVPEQPFKFENSIIEDDFTKRISLGKSVIDCLYALPEDDNGSWAIYGTKETDVISTKDLFKNCPIGYGKDFKLLDWINSLHIQQQEEILLHVGELDEETGVSDLPDMYRNMFYGCVPDAIETNEYWYLKPLTMNYLGYIEQRLDYNINVYDPEVLQNIRPRFD